MNILIDTNVLSEVRRPTPSPRVLRWLDALDEDRTFISVISLAEIRQGICLLDEGPKRTILSAWLENDLRQRFSGRLLLIDERVAFAWGEVMSDARRNGAALTAIDGWLAATARAHDLVLATRNIKDFNSLSLRLIDPWAC